MTPSLNVVQQQLQESLYNWFGSAFCTHLICSIVTLQFYFLKVVHCSNLPPSVMSQCSELTRNFHIFHIIYSKRDHKKELKNFFFVNFNLSSTIIVILQIFGWPMHQCLYHLTVFSTILSVRTVKLLQNLRGRSLDND